MLVYQRVNPDVLRPKNRMCSFPQKVRPQWRRLSPQRSGSPRGRGTATCPSSLGQPSHPEPSWMAVGKPWENTQQILGGGDWNMAF